MRIAILETVAMQGGHEVEFDRLIVESLRETGYCPLFFVPQGFRFSIDYNVEAFSLKGGPSISHSNARGLKRIGLSVLRSIQRLLWFSDPKTKLSFYSHRQVIGARAFSCYENILKTQHILNYL